MILDHISIAVSDYAASKAFYTQALEPLGLREICHPTCYGAFVIGPDGHNIEAVCHSPEP